MLRHRGDRWPSVEAKLAEYRTEIQQQAQVELKAKVRQGLFPPVYIVIALQISAERLHRLHAAAALHGGGALEGEERREGGLAERNPGAAARHGENV